MLESLYAKENARWKWRNISLNLQDFVSVLFRVERSPGGKDGRWKQQRACDNHDQVIIICLHLLSLSSFTGWHGKWHSQPLSLKKPFLSSQTARADRVREEEKRADRGIFPTRGFLLFFPFPLWSISVLLVKNRAVLPSCRAGLESCWARGEIRVCEKKKNGGAAAPRGYLRLRRASRWS